MVDSPRTYTSRSRSKRPLAHELPRATIAMLRGWRMLNPGRKHRITFDNSFVKAVSTDMTGEGPTFTIEYGTTRETIELESRRLGNGLTWYFKDLKTGALRRVLYFNGASFSGPEDQKPVYARQYQTKIHRQMLNLEPLLIAIEGDSERMQGPARGKSRLEKIAELRQILHEICSNDRAREKVLAKFPDFQKSIDAAEELLGREIPKLPKGWDGFDEYAI